MQDPVAEQYRLARLAGGPGGTGVSLIGNRADYDRNWATGVNCATL